MYFTKSHSRGGTNAKKHCKFDYAYELDRLNRTLAAADSLFSPQPENICLTVRHRTVNCKRYSYVYKQKKAEDGTYISSYQNEMSLPAEMDLINNYCSTKVSGKVKTLKKTLQYTPEEYDPFEIQRVYEDLYDAFGELTPEPFRPNSLQVKKWLSQKIPRNYFPEELKHPTFRGDKVRSKYEQAIANVLHELEIPYLYEKPKIFNNSPYLPDFTIIDPQNGSFVYIEAFGKLDDPGYSKASVKKIHDYEKEGLIQGKDLFLVFDDPQSPFDPSAFRKLMVNRFF